ncbi:hypothetical protein [Undibacterium fentianense]|uniref:Uncharacterized protein n=1 Tax=Undibacterium fentianense TaxID=2828728 RepID=A0A941E9E8_9BURK|nr:hypothetical protein [Undibacterium fentianense]MBR7801038.1 hypothetical protein [Undibacterium fentianense]
MSSYYLNEGRKQEQWELSDIEIDGDHLSAKVAMRSMYTSDTDTGGFHLSIFSTLEFLSQLMIIYGHVWSGQSEKTKEAWMVESHTKTVRAIRRSSGIRVDMKVKAMRRRNASFYCIADFKISDDLDGLFEVSLKGFLV